ncbi:hypothetical protein SAE01_36590 [Segetibacter aerophilus]|uniref:Uncharacterized protein n=2 Tax=Segetibacter aerophilus TaxID=670293 RepID=A0A512BGS1_9BACT|nr:hypothetical protein SAE01_36590 [Segetibacter aerophilus]
MLHQEIDQLQQDILVDVKKKLPVELPNYEKKLYSITASVITLIDSVQLAIEADSLQNDSAKYTSLKRWQVLLNDVSYALHSGGLVVQNIPVLLNKYSEARALVANNQSILPVIKESDLTLGRVILNTIGQENPVSFNESKEYLVRETFNRDPSVFFPTLFEFPDVICADSLLILAATKMPEELYAYSQASLSKLGQRILTNSDTLVKLIADIAKLPKGTFYLPFIYDLYHKKISFDAITNTLGKDKRVFYYQLLIKTLIGYNKGLASNDTAIAFQYLTKKIALTASYDFVRVLNALHEYKDDIRLKVIEDLNSIELYYLCINGVNDLFTSSYLKIYNRIFQKTASLNTYTLLKAVYFDHFKRFLKMASTFNTLDDFLRRMKKEEADTLMHAFIDGLNGNNAIEDAVDVADSYASIHNNSLRQFILKEIQNKIDIRPQTIPDSLRIYSLLNTLFLSLNTTNHINLTATLGIANVYRIENSSLQNKNGSIIIQQFFYGDQDGQDAFNIFIKSFRNTNWKIIRSKYWYELVNTKGIPVHIYANLPLDDNTKQAEYAQQVLSNYLKKRNIVPSVIIHRGHSYHLNNTLKLLSPENKLVFIGSCGGYNQLNQVYKISPLAQIVATKQEGSITINQPLINYIIELLVKGKNLDWPSVWKTLSVRFKNDNRFQDYVPPYRNLGAIMLMALNSRGFKGK